MIDYVNVIDQAVSEPVQAVAYPPNEAPDMPYIIVIDNITRTGGDMHKGMTIHDITIERYSVDPEPCEALEAVLDTIPAEWTREVMWIPSPENCFETVYTLSEILDNT